jgi:hypothetical protein
MKMHDHFVHIDLGARELQIFRVLSDGQKELYTAITLPESSGWTEKFESFAKQLGENLLLDSPVARKLLDL